MHAFKIIIVSVNNALTVFYIYQHPARMPAKPGLVQYQTGMGYMTMTGNHPGKLPGVTDWIVHYTGWFSGYENSVLRGAIGSLGSGYSIIYHPVITFIHRAINIKLTVVPDTTAFGSLAYYRFIRKISTKLNFNHITNLLWGDRGRFLCHLY